MLSRRGGASWDRSLLLARHGYLFTAALTVAERRQLHDHGAVTLSFLGRAALMVSGDAGVELFYDEQRVKRHRAVPAPIATSLFGPGAVHALDDEAHRHRKTLFRSALGQHQLERLLAIAERRWRRQLRGWQSSGGGDLYSAAVSVFGASIIEWAGIEEPETEMRRHARWMADIIDGFGVPGPAYLRAARARQRCDRWAAGLIREARAGATVPPGSWLAQVASFVDSDGEQLSERTAGVELLNVLRPTVAVSWLACFATVALAEHAQWRPAIRDEARRGGQQVAEAFAHEVRRYFPFVPVLAARARRDFEVAGQAVSTGQRVILDVHGTNHGPQWQDPWCFDPTRFLGADPCSIPHYVPQGGGPVETGHRCPGEGFSNGLLVQLVQLLAEHEVVDLPPQDRQYSLRQMPTRPRSGVRVRF